MKSNKLQYRMFTIFKNTYCLSSGSWSWLDAVSSWLFWSAVYFFSSSECILNLLKIVSYKIIFECEIHNLKLTTETSIICLKEKYGYLLHSVKLPSYIARWIFIMHKYKHIERSPEVLSFLINIYILHLSIW